MKITILGAGAMGCLFASWLSENNDVTLIDSFKGTVDAINHNGVRILNRNGVEKISQVKIYESGKCDEKTDLLIVFVKDTATDVALSSNIDIIGENTVVLSLQNGMGNDDVIKKYIPQERILLGTTKHNSVATAPGCASHTGRGVTNIGSLSGNTEMAQTVVSVFSDCGIDTKFSQDIKYLLWEKLFVNMTINSTTSLLGTTIDFLSYDSPIDPVITRLLEEAVQVAKADGVEFDSEKVKDNIYKLCSSMVGGKASMCQDMEHGRITEIDFINGAVVALGKKYNIATPTHNAMVSLVHSKEKLVCR